MFFFSTGALIMLAGIVAYYYIYNENSSKDSGETAELRKKSVGDDSVFAQRQLKFWEKLNLIKAEGWGWKCFNPWFSKAQESSLEDCDDEGLDCILDLIEKLSLFLSASSWPFPFILR